MQCIAAAESSRLNPYALHPDEYSMLRDHISQAQVTNYLNIRNGILRLWIWNPRIAVTREEAIGCAKDTRWFDVASVCFDWLVRQGYINFGCVEIKPSRKNADDGPEDQAKQKTIVVIGAGMSGSRMRSPARRTVHPVCQKIPGSRRASPRVIILEGRDRIGGRVYSRPFRAKPRHIPGPFQDKRLTAEMGGMIITGFERGNPLNVLVRGQLSLPYYELRTTTTLYDSNGKPVDQERDLLVEKLFNYCLERVSEYKFKTPTSKLIEGREGSHRRGQG